MKTNTYLKVIVLACAGALASCATQPQVTKVPMSASLRPDNSLAGQVHKEVNSYRRSHGASELQRHPGLDRLAQEHCKYLLQHRGTFGIYGKNVSHFGFEGRADMIRTQLQMRSSSENVAAATPNGQAAAPLLVKLWSESNGHDYNMLAAWTYSGVGVVVDSDGKVFSTQIFATGAPYSQLASRDRFSQH
jgi:uncharacterized protein YkwD